MAHTGKTVFVTGSSRGIGKAIALAFAKSGYGVALNASKSEEELAKAYNEFNRMGLLCTKVLADVSIYTQAEKALNYVYDEFGSIDVVVNNAGISYVGLFSEMKPEEWERIIKTNLGSVLNCTHAALPYMLKRRKGSIINISSVWGQKGAACEAVYSASKGAVDAFTKSMAREAGLNGIRVNAISCGVIDTVMNAWLSGEEKKALADEIALGRFGKPEEAAALALFLAGDEASYITGQVIALDGGMI